MKKIILLIMILILGMVTKQVNADFIFGESIKVPNVNSSSYDAQPSLSVDGLELYFISNRPHGGEIRYADIWVASRATTEEEWGEPVKLGAPVNSSASEGDPCISADGLELYFSDWLYDCDGCKLLPGGYGGGDLWVSTRATIDDPWGEPVNLGPTVNSSAFDSDASLSADGLELYFNSNRPGGYGYCDIWVTRRATTSDPWGAPVNLGPTVNSSIDEGDAEISSDGLTLYFNRWNSSSNNRYATPDLWQAPIIPIVDLNGDGIVDATDMCIIVDHWGENYSLCDIGPTPLGDGIVDVHDLIVLAEHLFEEVPPVQ